MTKLEKCAPVWQFLDALMRRGRSYLVRRQRPDGKRSQRPSAAGSLNQNSKSRLWQDPGQSCGGCGGGPTAAVRMRNRRFSVRRRRASTASSMSLRWRQRVAWAE
jgi:hypothetical protein